MILKKQMIGFFLNENGRSSAYQIHRVGGIILGGVWLEGLKISLWFLVPFSPFFAKH
jgi:hypothetical protein